MAQFEIKDVSFSYASAPDRRALSHLSLSIEKGEYVSVCGESGSGKTTLLKQLKSVLTPMGDRSGRILFEGKELSETDLRTQSARIGYVMQSPSDQIVTDKVWHELAFGLENLGMDPVTIRLRVAEMASYFGISDWFHRNVWELSGGQRQLLNLASVMAMQPDILILDEPTSQLDPIAASDFLNTVKKINRELRTTILITEHRLEEILPASDRVLVMEGGQILADEAPQHVGKLLWEKRHPMFAAMPTPMQIYYRCMSSLGENKVLYAASPLTIREGAGWLERYLEPVPTIERRLSEKHTGQKEKEAFAVQIKELWFRYDKHLPDILKGLSLQVPKGSVFAMMGGNGTGKSTLLKNICGVCKPYRGNVLTEGKVSMLPQEVTDLFVKETVAEELEEMLTEKNRQESLQSIIEICEIETLLKRHPYDLSGGEQQRVALAKVLLTGPDILLLDEPTKGLDPFFREKLAGILRKLTAQGMTILLVSHDVEFCARHADRVGMFFDGCVLAEDVPQSFFAHNSFYTTAANKMSRHVFENAVTNEDVIELCRRNTKQTE